MRGLRVAFGALGECHRVAASYRLVADTPIRSENPMNLSFQMILANVTNLERSAEFYSEVFDFPIAARDSEVVTLMVNHGDRRQVLVLRRTYSTIHPGRGTVGARLVAFAGG